jgi:hypothetical protein
VEPEELAFYVDRLLRKIREQREDIREQKEKIREQEALREAGWVARARALYDAKKKLGVLRERSGKRYNLRKRNIK